MSAESNKDYSSSSDTKSLSSVESVSISSASTNCSSSQRDANEDYLSCEEQLVVTPSILHPNTLDPAVAATTTPGTSNPGTATPATATEVNSTRIRNSISDPILDSIALNKPIVITCSNSSEPDTTTQVITTPVTSIPVTTTPYTTTPVTTTQYTTTTTISVTTTSTLDTHSNTYTTASINATATAGSLTTAKHITSPNTTSTSIPTITFNTTTAVSTNTLLLDHMTSDPSYISLTSSPDTFANKPKSSETDVLVGSRSSTGKFDESPRDTINSTSEEEEEEDEEEEEEEDFYSRYANTSINARTDTCSNYGALPTTAGVDEDVETADGEIRNLAISSNRDNVTLRPLAPPTCHRRTDVDCWSTYFLPEPSESQILGDSKCKTRRQRHLLTLCSTERLLKGLSFYQPFYPGQVNIA